MAEEVKTQETQSPETKEEKSKNAGVILKIILGIVFVLLGLLAVVGWWQDLWTVFKGCIGLFLILAGVITIAIAKE